MQQRYEQWTGRPDGTLPSILLGQHWLQIIASFITGNTPVPDPPPLEVFATWVSGDASQHVKSFDPRTSFVTFDVPLGLYLGSVTARYWLTNGAITTRAESFDLENPTTPSPFDTKSIDSEGQCLLAQHIDIILDDDERNTDIIKAIEKRGVPELPPFPFRDILTAHQNRTPGFPVWQICAFANALENIGKQLGPDDKPRIEPGFTPEDVEGDTPADAEQPEVQIPVVNPPAPADADTLDSGSAIAEAEIGAETSAASAGGPDIVVPVRQNDGSIVGETVVSERPPSATESEGTTPSETETTDNEEATEPGPPPTIERGAVVGRMFVEVPFEESAWPHVEIGSGEGPFRIEKLDVPWVEDANGIVVGVLRSTLISAAQKRFEEINAESTIEGTEEIEIAGFFNVEMGSLVRNVTFSFGDGGSQPRMRVSSSGLISKRFPLMRAVLSSTAKTNAEKRGDA